MLRKIFLFGIFLLLSATPSLANEDIFNRYVAYIAPWRSAPDDSLLARTALFFLDSPYVAHTLELPGNERLVVNLREFDCATFVESVLALARTARSETPTYDLFLAELRTLRYRNGFVDGYGSRLHYFTDWLHDNERKGLLENLSAELGGKVEKKSLHFMSSHRKAYRQLKQNDSLWRQIRLVEKEINRRDGVVYLPKEKIMEASPFIPHMSIIAFTTNIDGLDVSHMGFAFRSGNYLTFIHASSVEKKVMIDCQSIADYCENRNNCTGMIVANPILLKP